MDNRKNEQRLQEAPVQSLTPTDLAARREMCDATRIAAQGKYKCRSCGKIAAQEEGLIVAMLGNVLLSVCPGCIQGHIIISREGSSIRIEMPRPSDNRVILASDLSSHGICAANPSVEKVSL